MKLKQLYICQYCNKSFNKKEGLTRHINQQHLHTLSISYHITCDICNKSISRNMYLKHLVNVHNISPCEACIKAELITKKKFNSIPNDIIIKYLTLLNNNATTLRDIRYYCRQFVSFYRLITTTESFTDEHINIFLSRVLEWKLNHPRSSNNRELTRLIYPNDEEREYNLYKNAMLLHNPYYKHDGTTSVFSKSFKGYIGLSDDEKRQKIRQYAKYDKVGRNQNQKEYWIKRGYSEEDAIIEAKKHINIFSLQKCIERYGEDEGQKRFNARQIKWQNTLKSKPIEEQMRINHSKVYKRGSKRGIESIFLHNLCNDESTHNVYIKDCGIVDLLINNKVIEFYGDYWHCNPNDPRFSDGSYFHPYLKMTAKEKWEFDKLRINKLINKGYVVKIIWEYDFKHNKERVLQECMEFLKND